jgi:DNA-binding SARP family transcriptional activator/EAL domain-containing protein (putative c-di-GMP-specific phosphodiesterase class I)
MTVTRIELLGGLRIDRGDSRLTSGALSGRRSELVLAYLAVEHTRSVSRDELANALWAGALPDSWAAALRGVVTEVRRFLELGGLNPNEVLVTERGGYRLRLPPGVRVDVDEVREEHGQARAALAAGDAAGAAAHAERAAQLAGLPFLPQHEGDWVDGVRDDLRAAHIAALETAVHAHADHGDLRAAARAAEVLVTIEPYSESAHQLRIGVLADAGDRAGAVRAYEHLREIMARELGQAPSAETEAVLERALSTTAPRGAGAPATAAAAALGDLSVLVVEDHDFQRRTMIALLRGLGVGMLAEAENGIAALEQLAATTAPNIILCDIDMPGMDGVEFVHHVAQRGLASAVIVTSGLDRSVLRAVQALSESNGLQVLGAVQKPVSAKRLGELLAGYRRPVPGVEAGRGGAELADALNRGAIVIEFEPIADLSTGRMSAACAVASWDADGRRVVPDAMRGATADAIRLAIHALEASCADGLSDLDVERWVPVSEAALTDPALPDRLIDVVRASEGDPEGIVCVVDERAVRRGRSIALSVLARLRVKGFGVCLDGYGGGPADPRLDGLPLTAVRLDPGLIGDSPALERALDAAGAAGVTAVAGGCETAADFASLLTAGAGHAHGSFIGEAMPAAELAGWASSWSPA